MTFETSSRTLDQSLLENTKKSSGNVNVKTCPKTGIFGFNGQCYGMSTIKGLVKNLKMPSVGGDNNMLQDVWDDYVGPLIDKINIMPNAASGCLGDFNTNYLLTNPESAAAKCKNFPLPEDEKMSAIGFSLKTVPCGDPTKVEICTIFDKCGTFGISANGGLFECFAKATGVGAILVPAAKLTAYAQFGYSPNRIWTHKFQFLDPSNDMNMKEVTLRSHVYMGAGISIPEIGIKIGKEDITKFFAFKIDGKAFIDFGNTNDFNPSNMKKLLNDNSISGPEKTVRFLQTAREYSFQARGSLHLKLAKKTKGLIPDLKLVDNMDYNMLINLGKGLDGDRGSSGMPAGVHIYMKPPPLDILGAFVEKILKSFGKAFKCLGIPAPKMPGLGGIELGFTIGQRIGFKIKVKSFEYQCMVKFDGGLGISCKTELGFLSIFAEQFEWVAKAGKVLFDAAEKAFMKFAASPAGEFAEDIGKGAIKFMGDLVGGAKIAYENAKKNYETAKRKTKNTFNAIGNAGKKAAKSMENAYNSTKNEINKIGKSFESGLKSVGNSIKKLFGGITKKQRRRNRNKKREAEEKKRKMEAEKAAKIAEENRKRDAEVKKIKEQEARENAQEQAEHKKAQQEEEAARVEEVNKNNAYQNALQRQKDL